MVLLSDYIKPTTAKLLDDGVIVSAHRPYLGMSQIGHACERYLWFSFHWAYVDTFPRRILRLFNRGHREEPVIVEDLERIGMKFSGDQDEVVCAWGHVTTERSYLYNRGEQNYHKDLYHIVSCNSQCNIGIGL
jgi:hypothetical protein